MRVPYQSTQAKGYSGRDASWAIKLIAEEKDVSHTELAGICGLTRRRFDERMHFNVPPKVHPASEFAKEYLGHSEPVRTKPVGFTPLDYTKMARYLGKKCGYEDGFSTPGAMVAYVQAQPQYKLPEGSFWVKTDYISQEETQELQEQIGKIKLYRKAAQLLIAKTGKPIYTFAEGLPSHDQVVKYLKGFGGERSDEDMLKKLKLIAPRIGKALHKKMDLVGMLKEAQKHFPDQMPDVDLGSGKGGKEY